MVYKSREEQIRAELSQEEAIQRIKERYQSQYDPSTPDFDAWDQLLACEAVAEATPIKEEITTRNVYVSGNGNDTYKPRINFELTPSKQEVIGKLNSYKYKTPREIAHLLEELFKECNTKKGWWLCVAQQWTLRAINRVVNRIIKIHTSGQRTIQNPAAYFTFLIKKRKKKRSL